VDTGKLLESHGGRASLTPINTGAALRKPARRGRATFVPYGEWLASGWSSEAEALDTRPRPRSHKPAELTISGAVPDVLEHAIEVRHLSAGEAFAP
jgi:hypothetical protein